MEIGDWIYIVFLIIAGVSGMFSSKDKKKKQCRPDILGQPDTEIIQEETAPEKAAPQPRRKTRIKKAKATAMTPAMESTPSPFLSGEQTIPDHPRTSTAPIPTIEEETGILSKEAFQDPAEWRKAVIYAEIMNRKY